MGSETDKIFRDKLKGLEQAPPPSAWSKVEKNVRKPRGLMMWLNIAAALLILVLGIWNAWPDDAMVKQTHVIADTLSVQPIPEPAVPQNENNASPEIFENKIVQPAIDAKHQMTKREIVSKQNIPPVELSTIQEPNEVVVQTINNSELPQDTKIEKTIAQHSVEFNNTSTTILYSAEEVNARFLKKPKTTKSPTVTQPSKPNTGQKISSIAVAIKNNEVGLGDLRQFKDELLAFDFIDNNHKNNHTRDQ